MAGRAPALMRWRADAQSYFALRLLAITLVRHAAGSDGGR